MAVVSELAMRQTQTLCLQQELREKEFELDMCHRRLEMGLAPSDAMEQEWLHQMQAQQKCQVDAQERAWVDISVSYTTHIVIDSRT